MWDPSQTFRAVPKDRRGRARTLEDTPVIIVGVSVWQAWVPVLDGNELGPLLTW